MTAWVHGVGTSQFGKQTTIDVRELASAAVTEAMRDADSDRVDAVYVGSCFGAPGTAQRVLSRLGIVGVPILTFENACASGTTAFHEAQVAVGAGRYGHVLVLGVEKMTEQFAGALPPEVTDVEGRAGMALPSVYAMSANRYVALHGLTPEDLALVSVKNHRHALGNPRAQYRLDCTVQEVLSSRMIADPLTLLQCSPISDGAAAVVLGGHPRSRRDVRVRASSLRSGSLWGASRKSDRVWGFDMVEAVSAEAYQVAGVGPADIDIFEVHDAFTIGELVTIEALGLCAEGMGAQLVRAGHTWIGGPQPVNPSGGLLSRGHPLGCTGVAQIAEVVWQLRGDAGSRQVGGARLGLVETLGGNVAGIDGNGCVVAILEGG